MPPTIDLTERSPRARIWLVVAGWTVVAIVMALILRTQEHLPLAAGLLSSIYYYYLLGGLVWLMCRVDARFGLWKRAPLKACSIHVVLGVLGLAVWSLLQVALMRLSVGSNYWTNVYAGTWMYQLLSAAMTYAAGLGLGLAIQASDREKERQRREAQLEAAAREAEIAVIKSQLQPHFLLNSLNSILVLMKHDVAEAEQMVTRLASLLHSVFDRLDEPLVPLGPELEMIRNYLEIEQIRFQDRLRFTIHADDDAATVSVPPLLLQPIVENAVKHGVAPHARPGEICIKAHRADLRLQIAVTDTGDGPAHAGRQGTGRGLELTERRLDAVYGEGRAAMRMERSPGGFTVTLDLPVSADVR